MTIGVCRHITQQCILFRITLSQGSHRNHRCRCCRRRRHHRHHTINPLAPFSFLRNKIASRELFFIRFYLENDGDLRFIAINQTHSITRCLNWGVWLTKLQPKPEKKKEIFWNRIQAVIQVTIFFSITTKYVSARERYLRSNYANIFISKRAQLNSHHITFLMWRRKKTMILQEENAVRTCIFIFVGGFSFSSFKLNE